METQLGILSNFVNFYFLVTLKRRVFSTSLNVFSPRVMWVQNTAAAPTPCGTAVVHLSFNVCNVRPRWRFWVLQSEGATTDAGLLGGQPEAAGGPETLPGPAAGTRVPGQHRR